MKYLGLLVLAVCTARPQSAIKTASIIVRDAATGKPPSTFSATLVKEEGLSKIGFSATLVNGIYRIDRITPGAYRLEAGGYMWTSVKNVRLVEGEELLVDFAVPSLGAITGRVLDDGKQPLAKARVSLIVKAWRHGKLNYSVSRRVETDALGFYHLDGLEPGDSFLVRADGSGSGGESPADTFYPGTTSPDDAEELVLIPGKSRDGVDIQRVRRTSHCISGTVEGFPAAVKVLMVRSAGALNDFPKNERNLTNAVEGPRPFLICGLPDGRYTVFTSGLNEAGTTSYISAGMVTVAGDHLRGVRLWPLSRFEFTAETIWDGISTHEAANANLSIQLTGNNAFSGFEQIASLTVPDKSSHISELAPVDYFVDVVQLRRGKGTYIKETKWNGQEISRGILSIVPGQVSCHVRVVVGDDGATLTVRVGDRQHGPAPYSYVAIIPTTAVSQADMAAKMIFGQADQHGSFVEDALPPGKYRVFATTDVIDWAAGRVSNLWNARSSGQELEVFPGADVRISLQPQPLK